MGDDTWRGSCWPRQTAFLPTSPVWGTTGNPDNDTTAGDLFLPTSPVWGTTVRCLLATYQLAKISTHVPRMGDDVMQGISYTPIKVISTHVPRMGDDRGGFRFLS